MAAGSSTAGVRSVRDRCRPSRPASAQEVPMSTRPGSARPLGRYGEASPPATSSSDGMVAARPQLAVRRRRDRPGAARRRRSWWSARSRPGPATAFGSPLEAVRRGQGRAAPPAGRPVAARTTGCGPTDVRIDLVGVLAAPARRRRGRPRARGRLMRLRHRAHHLAGGRDRAPDRRPGRRLATGWSPPPWSGAPTPRSTRPATAAGPRCRTAGFDWPVTRRVTILLSPADLPKRGSHFDLAIAVGVLAATGKVPRRRRWTAWS